MVSTQGAGSMRGRPPSTGVGGVHPEELPVFPALADDVVDVVADPVPPPVVEAPLPLPVPEVAVVSDDVFDVVAVLLLLAAAPVVDVVVDVVPPVPPVVEPTGLVPGQPTVLAKNPSATIDTQNVNRARLIDMFSLVSSTF